MLARESSWVPRELVLPLSGTCVMYICDVPDNEPEFSLRDVTHWLWASTDAASRQERWKKHEKTVNATYLSLWKEDAPPRRQCAGDTSKDPSKGMMYERTISTRMTFTLVYFGLTHEHFDDSMRRRLGTIVHALLENLFSKLPDTASLSMRALGTAQRVQLPINIGPPVVNADDAWPVAELRQCFSQMWHQAALDETRTWLSSTPNRMPLASFLLFGLDRRFVENSSCLLSASVDLLTQVAQLCTAQTLQQMTTQVNLSRKKEVGSTIQVRKGFRVNACFKACQAIANQEVFCLF